MTDRELLQEALDALTYVGDKDIYSGTIDALRARLATCDRCGKVNPAELHTCTPPQRGWIGLTDEEVADIGCDFATLGGDIDAKDWFAFYLAVEQVLKEKNT